jgi:ankyrin repeat protein
MIPHLIELGAEVDRGDASLCLSPLSLAALKGNVVAAKHLLEAGADPHSLSAAGRSPMFHAVERGHAAVVTMLAQKFSDLPKMRCKDSIPFEFPVHVAVTFRQLGCFGLLVRLGADPDTRNGEGLTAMDIAARSGVLEDATRELDAARS